MSYLDHIKPVHARKAVYVSTQVPIEVYRKLIQIDPDASVYQLVKDAVQEYVERRRQP